MLYYCNHCKEFTIARKAIVFKNGSKIQLSYCINKGCVNDRKHQGDYKCINLINPIIME